MSGQNLTLLKFPHSNDEIITERINGIYKLLCETNNDEHINKILEMLITYISSTYEGTYPDQALFKLIEAHAWYSELYNPDITLSVNQIIDE